MIALRLCVALTTFCAAVTGIAFAQVHVTGQIVCDNSFALYAGDAGGGNLALEAGGAFPAVVPVDFFTDRPALYLVAWSDDAVHQGLLHNLSVAGVQRWSDDPAWSVLPTRDDLDADYPAAVPDPVALGVRIAAANGGGLWQPVTVGGPNDGTFPSMDSWEVQFPIPITAHWAWYDSGRVGWPESPFRPGFDHGEVLVFRLALELPSPGDPPTWSRVKALFR